MKAGRVAGGMAWVLLGVLGVSTVRVATARGDATVVREYRAEVALDINAQGEVSAVGLPGDIPPMLAGPAREAIGHWRFRPPVRDGHAVTARTYAKATVQVVQQAHDTYGVRAVYRSNGPKLHFAQLPAYPPNEIRQRGQGGLVMEATVRPDGSLSDVHVAGLRFNHPNDGAFIKSAEAVMEHASAQPELVDGAPVATRVQVPFTFTLREASYSEALARSEKPPAAAPALADDASPIGEPVALDSPTRIVAPPD